MNEEHLVQGSKKWLEWRKSKITATNSCILMNGVHFGMTPLDLYNEKISFECDEIEPNYAMKRGTELEPLALAKFESKTGYLMTPRVLVHPTIPYMAASLDGLELDSSCAVEIKCPGKADHDLALKGIVPEKYIAQLQHIIEVCQLEEIYYMSYRSDSDFTIFKVKKDHDYTKRLLQAEFEFWQRVQDRNPPQPTDRDCIEITSKEWTHYRDQYTAIYTEKKDLLDKLKQLESIEENIRKELIHLADQKSAFGAGIKLTKSIRRGHIDYARVSELNGVDLELHRKPSTESWRITIEGEKDE